MENVQLSVSDFVGLVNQSLEYAYPVVNVIGEVSEFKVSQGKWVSFKLKDADAILRRFDYWLGVHKGERYLMANGSRLFNKKELAEALGVARPTLDRWIANGWLEPCRVQISAGGDTLFATNAVREVLITFSNE